MDRFTYVESETRLFGMCEECKGEIWEGDYYYLTFDGEELHDECVEDYAKKQFCSHVEAVFPEKGGDF